MEIALLVTGGFDRGIIEPTCHFIEENADKFGKTIIDIGCDIGIVTCFIAASHPDSEVVGLDVNENGIRIARQLADKLKLTNISFICADLNSYQPIEKYDTVFTSRCIQEAMTGDKHYTPIPYDPLYRAKQSRDLFSPVVKAAGFIKDSGYYLALERVGPVLFKNTYYILLGESGCRIDESCSGVLPITSVGVSADLMKVVAQKTNQPLSEEEIIQNNMKSLLQAIDMGTPLVQGDEALTLLWGDTKSLELGYIGYESNFQDPVILLFALMSKSDETAIYRLYYSAYEGQCIMERHDIRELQDMKNMIEYDVSVFSKRGIHFVPFSGKDKEQFQYSFHR